MNTSPYSEQRFRASELSLPSASELRKRCPEAFVVVETLRDAGYIAYFAGGAVRDLLRGKAFKDIDIASDAPPDEVEQLFENTHAIGKSFGVIQVLIDSEPFEVAAFRQDREYLDGRHPEGYEPTSPDLDAQRRDFSINGLFLDPIAMEVIDYVGGVADLQQGLIRAIGDPRERFAEDQLRLLRALRFSTVLEFPIEPQTLEAIRELAPRIQTVSVERILKEIIRILTEAPRAGDALEALADSGLLQEILPEALELKGCEQPPQFHPEGDVWVHTCMMLNELDQPSPALALGTLLHDIGKPATFTVEDGRIRNPGHAQVGAEMAQQWLNKMKAGSKLREQVVGLVDRHMNYMNVSNMRKATLRRTVAMEHFEDEIELHRIDCLCSNGITESVEKLKVARAEFLAKAALPKPLILGEDLMELGLSPGPLLGEWKQKAYDRQLEENLEDKEQLLQWLRKELQLG